MPQVTSQPQPPRELTLLFCPRCGFSALLTPYLVYARSHRNEDGFFCTQALHAVRYRPHI